MHHTDSHNTLVAKPQGFRDQPYRVKGTPSEAMVGVLLRGLNQRLGIPSLDAEADRRYPEPGISALLSPDCYVLPGVEVVQQGLLEMAFLGHNAGPLGRACRGFYVIENRRDRVYQLVAGTRQADLILQGPVGVEEVAERSHLGLGRGAPVQNSQVRTIDL